MEMSGLRGPGTNAGARSRLHEIDRRQAAEVVTLAVPREILLVRAPAHLARLTALTDKPVDGPGVDELTGLLGNLGDLVVTLGDVHHLDAELTGEITPFAARCWIDSGQADVSGDVEHRDLGEVRHQARVRTMRDHSGRCALVSGTQRQSFLTQRVVRAARGRHRWIGVTARPRLDAGVEIHRTTFPGQREEREPGILD